MLKTPTKYKGSNGWREDIIEAFCSHGCYCTVPWKLQRGILLLLLVAYHWSTMTQNPSSPSVIAQPNPELLVATTVVPGGIRPWELPGAPESIGVWWKRVRKPPASWNWGIRHRSHRVVCQKLPLYSVSQVEKLFQSWSSIERSKHYY